jgi:hypothetical protein
MACADAACAGAVAVCARFFLGWPLGLEVRVLRLLDHIAQCTAPFVVRQEGGELWHLTGANDFARRLQLCPLRYVLSDDLVRTCTALAYSEGDELCGCLDLLHLPSESLWVEWDEGARRTALTRALPQLAGTYTPEVVRAGALISARPGGRAGTLRTFCLTREPAEALLAPVETLLDFDAGGASCDPEALLEGHAVAVRDPHNAQSDELLQCASFRLDSAWQRYYAGVPLDAATRAHVIRRSLAAVVLDVPILLALFLLMAIRAELVHQPVRPARLNAKRARLGKPPLLEHIEVSAPVFAPPQQRAEDPGGVPRRGPRLHHVRGHIVRRRNAVYWRGPHWRGHVRLGSVRSRTVELQLPG